MDKESITQHLPYTKPFLFVDQIIGVSEDHIEGNYTFSEDEYFYQGHFKDMPVTPGVILTECMAQIGLACLGIYLFRDDLDAILGVVMTNSSVDYYKPVFPGETVRVVSDKEYFRFNKLKCTIKMYNSKDVLVAKGTLAGMMKPWKTDE
ncbi:FabA/FabZ family ACP-dehydratase [Aquimarina sp. 2201CG5-10]|uniref:3-hydroxyacyl-ACP dehydratase FabZ family protein n=1 Tax=Aquimarina callyspongiae TaxID=3098150 RepID=UPI002AB4FDC0|nr:FabA/FabZ family ACP-dehydratase [Aquimarina sp. 2201CG5-10]MDY8136102.1 FabA/FabZ family ACP-dehydratase [Aquimarina sp. 2201CG5-10]